MKVKGAIALAFLLIAGITSIGASSASQQGPINRVVLDFTFDPETGAYSIGGIDPDMLQAIGAPALDANTLALLARFEEFNVDFNNLAADVNVDGVPLATVNWNNESRAAAFQLANRYGVVREDALPRLEDWLGLLNFEVTARNSSELSDPLFVHLDTPIRVDVEEDRNLLVEGFYVGALAPAEVVTMADQAGIENATLCWKEGTITMDVNNASLPGVSLYPEGVKLLAEKFQVQAGNVDPFFDSRLGTSVSLNGEHPEGATCAD